MHACRSTLEDPTRHIRLAGQADGGGDVLLEIQYRPHHRFKVENRDVSVDVAVKPWDAALGATVDVPTLAGTVSLKVPPGSTSGKRLRLKGRGMPGDPPGDQYAVIQIAAPKPETDAQREAYEKLRDAFQ